MSTTTFNRDETVMLAPVILALGRLRQGFHPKFRTNLGYTVRQ